MRKIREKMAREFKAFCAQFDSKHQGSPTQQGAAASADSEDHHSRRGHAYGTTGAGSD
jgi:hypothetical protein